MTAEERLAIPSGRCGHSGLPRGEGGRKVEGREDGLLVSALALKQVTSGLVNRDAKSVKVVKAIAIGGTTEADAKVNGVPMEGGSDGAA